MTTQFQGKAKEIMDALTVTESKVQEIKSKLKEQSDNLQQQIITLNKEKDELSYYI